MEGIVTELSERLTNRQSRPPQIRPLGVKKHYTFTPMTPINEMNYPDFMISVDDILNHIGFGRYQMISILVIGLMLINDGTESIVLSFLVSVLKNDWNLDISTVSLFSSAVFGGVFIGSALSEKLADRYGRLRMLAGVELLIYLTGIASANAKDIVLLTLIRGIYGFLLGLRFPTCFQYINEVTPLQVRLKTVLLAGGFITLGKIFAAVVADLTLVNMESGDWHKMLFWLVQPSIVALTLLAIFLKESPFYHIIVKKDLDEGLYLLKSMWRFNHANATAPHDYSNLFSAKNKIGLQNWADSTYAKKNVEKITNIANYIKEQFRTLHLSIWVTWFVLPAINYGILFTLPTVLTNFNHIHVEHELLKVIVVVLAEVPSVLVANYLIDKKMVGAKQMTVFGMVGTTLSFITMLLFVGELLIFGLASARFFLNICFQAALSHNSQLYSLSTGGPSTKFLFGWKRLAIVLVPWITKFLLASSVGTLFAGYLILSIVVLISALCMPQTLRAQELEYTEMKVMKSVPDLDMLDSEDI